MSSIDLHKAFFQACALSQTGARLWETRVPRTAEGVTSFLPRLSAATTVAVEPCGPTCAFVDAIASTSAVPCVVDTRKTKLAAGYAAKTDRLDARRLADAVRRRSVVSIYIPPLASRAVREQCRSRQQLVRLRTRVVQRLRALLLRTGAPDAPMRQLYSAPGLAWLADVVWPAEATVSGPRLTQLLRVVQGEVIPAEAALRAQGAADPPAGALDGLVGIGPVLGLTLRAEIGDITRFPRGPQLASSAGVVPRVHQSGARGYGGHITKEGAPWVRWALGGSRPPCDAADGCAGPVGAPPATADGHRDRARCAGPAALRRDREGLAADGVKSSPRAAVGETHEACHAARLAL